MTIPSSRLSPHPPFFRDNDDNASHYSRTSRASRASEFLSDWIEKNSVACCEQSSNGGRSKSLGSSGRRRRRTTIDAADTRDMHHSINHNVSANGIYFNNIHQTMNQQQQQQQRSNSTNINNNYNNKRRAESPTFTETSQTIFSTTAPISPYCVSMEDDPNGSSRSIISEILKTPVTPAKAPSAAAVREFKAHHPLPFHRSKSVDNGKKSTRDNDRVAANTNTAAFHHSRRHSSCVERGGDPPSHHRVSFHTNDNVVEINNERGSSRIGSMQSRNHGNDKKTSTRARSSSTPPTSTTNTNTNNEEYYANPNNYFHTSTIKSSSNNSKSIPKSNSTNSILNINQYMPKKETPNIQVISLPWTDHRGIQGKYSGEVNDLIQPHGPGALVYKDGMVFTSIWCNGMPNFNKNGGQDHSNGGGGGASGRRRSSSAGSNSKSRRKDTGSNNISSSSSSRRDDTRGKKEASVKSSSCNAPRRRHTVSGPNPYVVNNNIHVANTAPYPSNHPPTSTTTNTTQRPKMFHPSYDLGQTSLNPRIDMIQPQSSKQNLRNVITLQVHDFAFVRRSDGKWTYAIIANRPVPFTEGMKDANEASIRFVVDKRGSTKTFMFKHWAKFIRLVNTTATTAAAAKLPVTAANGGGGGGGSDGSTMDLTFVSDEAVVGNRDDCHEDNTDDDDDDNNDNFHSTMMYWETPSTPSSSRLSPRDASTPGSSRRVPPTRTQSCSSSSRRGRKSITATASTAPSLASQLSSFSSTGGSLRCFLDGLDFYPDDRTTMTPRSYSQRSLATERHQG